MRKTIIFFLILMFVVFFLGIHADIIYGQIIDPHPACSSPDPACWPTRIVNQHSCSDCDRGWFCFGNTTRSCSDAYGNGSDALCGGAGPCMWLCDETIPNNYPRCSVFDADVICNEVTASTCRWRDTVVDCVEDVVNRRCNLTSTTQTLSCCGPGSAATSTPVPTDTPTPTPVPASCSINVGNIIMTIASSSQDSFVGISSEVGGNIETVSFVSGDNSIATVTSPDNTPVFSTSITPQGVGTTNYTATATMDTGDTCSDTGNIEVTDVDAWWQIKEGYAVTNGSIRTEISPECSGSCDDVFITHDAGEYPGVPTHNNTFGVGTVSSTGWIARSRYSSPDTHDYDFFRRRVPEGVSLMDINASSQIETVGTPYNGYIWLRYDGSLGDPFVIDDINLETRKVILFVENASVLIQGRVQVDDGRGFFLLVSDRNIRIDEGFGGGSNFHLEGMYFADEQIFTGAGDAQLRIRGSMVGLGDQGGVYHINQAIIFERDLTDDTQDPAEFIEYAPDQAILFPPSLGKRNIIWKEVAP